MKKISKICCLLTCLSLVSCGDVTISFIPTKGVTTLLKKSQEPLNINYDHTKSENFKTFLDKFTNFSLKFNDSFLNTYDDKSSNVAISPLSLFFALAMTSECTANNSQIELLNALNMTTSELRENIPILYGLENTTSYSYDAKKDEKILKSVKDLNNSLWFSNKVNKSINTLNNLANFYYVDSYETDFKNHNTQANKDLKAYVKDKTRGLIEPSFNLDIDTLLVLLNTFYVKDVWNEIGYDLSLTDTLYDFIGRNESINKTNLMMGNYVGGRAIHTDSYSSFFTKTQYGLKIHFLVPNESYKLDDVFNKENINNILNLNNYEYSNHELKERYFTSTYFPSFEASCNEDLVDLLRENFKIYDMFNQYKADFTNISFDDEMYVSKVIHQTKLKVERKGIEGAAITAVIFDEAASGIADGYTSVYETFVVDKSFGYVITDKYGVMLFSGVVNNI